LIDIIIVKEDTKSKFIIMVLINIKKKVSKIMNSNKYLKLLFYKARLIRLRSIIGKRNIINNSGMLINVKYDIIGDDNIIIIGVNAFVTNTTIRIRGNKNNINIENECKYYGGSIWIEGTQCKVKIGNNTTVMDAHIFAQEAESCIEIGEDCMLSNNIIIRTSDSHSIIDNVTKERINKAKNIYIGNHVWIAAWVRVLKGTRIYDNSIIALGSIVSNDVPTNCIVGGIPAKVIKQNINWTRDQI
jgi:acetyltransferase-like isoleucine patch superfamily enzyme